MVRKCKNTKNEVFSHKSGNDITGDSELKKISRKPIRDVHAFLVNRILRIPTSMFLKEFQPFL